MDAGVPAFGWRAVRGADHYEVGLSADPSFSSPVAQGFTTGPIVTRNTRATLTAMVPNGTYWWHVRAVSKDGAVSGWSQARSFRRAWTQRSKLLEPANGATILFPKTPLVLRWSPVDYAAKYLVLLATDSDLGSLVGGREIETDGLSFSPSVTLADGTYFWAVMPVDARGNRGARSRVSSFQWRWPSATKPAVTDLVGAQEHYDPRFTWTPVPGAARYEVEINPSKDWAVGSKVCCRDPLVTTTFSPTQLLANNKYFWRVRAINMNGNAGTWYGGPSFTKTFDNVESPKVPTIKNLRVIDSFGNVGKPGVVTSSPIVTWDPVPGASKYEIDVSGPPPCSPRWPTSPPVSHAFTAVPAWTPLATPSPPNAEPYPVPNLDPAREVLLCPGVYNVRVRAYTDDGVDRQPIFGNFAYLTSAFTFVEPPTGCGACVPAIDSASYLSPVRGQVARSTPLFTWKPISGAGGYWVLVSKDKSFTTIVDYGFTRVPAYAPRLQEGPKTAINGGIGTYPDEETEYYWAVLPAGSTTGAASPIDPNFVPSADFQKRSTPPSILEPKKEGALIYGPPAFRWTPALGARHYRLQVSQDSRFGTLLDDIVTDSTAYAATKTYPATAALYMRVRAEDENEIGLTWSRPRRFRNTLARAVPDGDNPKQSDFIPTWTWKPVQGAASYDLHVDLPNGTTRDFANNLLTAFTPTIIRGTGVFHWRVRAVFPQGFSGTPGPYSRSLAFTRTISPPTGARATSGAVMFTWKPKAGAKTYRVQIAATPAFGRTMENVITDTTSFAPTFSFSYEKGKTYFWRVAAVDADNNTGNFTPTGRFRYRG